MANEINIQGFGPYYPIPERRSDGPEGRAGPPAGQGQGQSQNGGSTGDVQTQRTVTLENVRSDPAYVDMDPGQIRRAAGRFNETVTRIYNETRDSDMSESQEREYFRAADTRDSLIDLATERERGDQSRNDADARRRRIEEARRNGNGAPFTPPDPQERGQGGGRQSGHIGDGERNEQQQMLARYNLRQAILELADHRQLTGVAAEIHQEIARTSQREARGLWVPLGLPVPYRRSANARAMQQMAHGSESRVSTQEMLGLAEHTVMGPLIDILRNQTLVTSLGVRVMTGLVGTVAFPTKTEHSNAYWITEANAPPQSRVVTGQIEMRPRTIGAFTDYTRQTLTQTSIDIEGMLREDLLTSVAIELDRAALDGSGIGAEPLGLLNDPNIPLYAMGANGGPLTYQDLIAIETSVQVANTLTGSLAYVTTPQARGLVRTTPVEAGFPTFVDSLIGYPFLATNQMPNNLAKGDTGSGLQSLIFGNWQDFMIGLWTGIDILIDPYTLGTAGIVRIIALQDADMRVRRTRSFVRSVDIEGLAIVS